MELTIQKKFHCYPKWIHFWELFLITTNKYRLLNQFAVKNEFLYGEFKEEVYMETSRGFPILLKIRTMQTKKSIIWTETICQGLFWKIQVVEITT